MMIRDGVFWVLRQRGGQKICISTKTVRAYCKCVKGVTAIEYGLIGAAIAIALAIPLALFGDELGIMFSGLTTVLGDTSL